MGGGAKAGWPNKNASVKSPRGVKNNNPGNLRISDNPWRGKIPLSRNTDGAFEQFESMVMGARAQLKNLKTYFNRGLNTVSKILNTYAPKSENDTNAYIAFVCKQLGVTKDQVLEFSPELLTNLGFEMSKMENGITSEITKQIYVEAFNAL